jgi:hypothetical protein
MDCVTLDLPLLMRLLELCREDIKDDVELHFLVEAIAEEQSLSAYALTMEDYPNIMKFKERYIFSKQNDNE